jgi:pyruvate dehydrogenase E2 component (dihydrolipoamide acetyltransferase)
VDIVLPKWGMSMQDGVISEWLVSVGDTVVEGQPIAVIETEKVDTDLPSPGAGTITELLVEPGDSADVGSVIARMV